MGLVVNTNVTSLIANRRLTQNSKAVQRSLERLASGFKINRAADDAAGLTISENLIGQVRGMKKALQNTQDGISVLQIAEGGLTVILNDLQRMRELAVQAGSATNSQQQRNAIGQEIRSLTEDVNRIALATQFNGINLLDGSALSPPSAIAPVIQVGPGSNTATNTIDISNALTSAHGDASPAVGGIGIYDSVGGTTHFTSLNNIFDPGTGLSLGLATTDNARSFLADADAAIQNITAQLATIGSFQNQMESVTTNLQIAIENFSASNSRIRDLDIAAESSILTQSQILQQASVQVLSQANTIPQLALTLLQQ